MSPTSVKMTGTIFAVLVALVTVPPVLAHHSFATEYDRTKPVSVTGVVKKVEWRNPHIWFYVDVKDAKDQVTNWNLELASPNVLVRQGWTRTSLHVGDQVTVNGAQAKDGSKMGNARTVTLADGRKVFAGSPSSGGNQ